MIAQSSTPAFTISARAQPCTSQGKSGRLDFEVSKCIQRLYLRNLEHGKHRQSYNAIKRERDGDGRRWRAEMCDFLSSSRRLAAPGGVGRVGHGARTPGRGQLLGPRRGSLTRGPASGPPWPPCVSASQVRTCLPTWRETSLKPNVLTTQESTDQESTDHRQS